MSTTSPSSTTCSSPKRARELREGLKNLYSVLKDADPHLEFVLLTGVSKFSKVSLFSGLNNLRDITLSEPFRRSAAIPTTTSIRSSPRSCQAWIAADSPLVQWLSLGRPGDPLGLQPLRRAAAVPERKFGAYWFESATPTFLVEILKQRGVFTPALTAWHSRPALLGRFDVDDIATEALLFQTGYLTLTGIREEVPNRPIYALGFPNQEVETSLNEALLPVLGLNNDHLDELMVRLPRLLKTADLPGLEAHLKALFAGLPHDWYRNNPIARYEGHYASVFYSHFAALGVRVTVEDASHHGKVDMSVDFAGHVYLFEFKVVEQLPDGRALQQIKDKGYADKYRGQGKVIHLIGVEFSREKRQIVAPLRGTDTGNNPQATQSGVTRPAACTTFLLRISLRASNWNSRRFSK
jgi:hypothetical protein